MLSRVVGTGVPDGPQIDLSVESHVIMPGHIHIMLWVKGAESGPYRLPPQTVTQDTNGPSGTPVPTTVQNSIPSRFVPAFKRFCNKEYGTSIWQYRSYDHIIKAVKKR